jgi:peptidoglycan-N-acetylglucosamine deacetylase
LNWPIRYAEAVRWHAQGLPWWRSSPPRRLKDLRSGRRRRDEAVALTFDDGPDPTFTPQVLRVLSDLDVHATFFMCGLAAERDPALVRAVAEAGHTIGGHTWHHRDVRGLSSAAWEYEVDRTHRLLEQLSGREIRYFRPPWCEYDRAALDRLRARQLTPVLFSSSGGDWTTTDPASITTNVLRSLQPGAIVLLHDGCGDLLDPRSQPSADLQRDRSGTIEALPGIVAGVRAAGLDCTALPS